MSSSAGQRILAPPPFLFGTAFAAGLVADLALGWGIPYERQIAVIVGEVMVCSGLALSASVVRTFRRAGTPVSARREPRRLVVTGPYRFTRNPDYLGQALVYAGSGLLLNALWILLALGPALIAVHYGVTEREEQYLEQRFGDDYRRYRQRVRGWL